ncbi:MAG: hypothetical protein FJ280_16415, partial [Planctomycetes bacterium]|nr:hypothetical protein [Planctomycetota bacterium]
MFPLSGRRTAAAVIVWFLALVTPLAAQEPPPEFELPDVISPGRRPQPAGTSPAYVTAIPGEELRRMGFLTLGEALAFVAEAYVRITGTGLGGVQQASIRGSTPQQVLVLLDGVPLNATAQFGVNLATITLADVERVEVLRGPYSAIQGNFAVIQVTTRSRPGRTAVVSSGSYGTLQTALRLDGGTAGLRFGLGSEIAATSGYRPNGDATRWTGSGRLAWGEASRGMFSLSVHRTTGDAGVPGPTYFPSLSDRLADGRTAVAFEWARKAADGSRLLRIWSLEDTLRSTSPDFGFVSESMGSAVGAEWQQVARLGHGGIFTWGL